jgi:DNA-binding transcriptional LysR family regulator
VAEASHDVAEMGREPRGLVRVSTPPPVGDGTIAELFAEFVRMHPQIRIEMVVANRRVNLVEEGIDLAVRAGKLDDSTLVARKVAVTELGLYAAPSYLERRGRPRNLAALALHDCVLYKAAGGLLPWRLAGPRGVERVDVTGAVVADDLGTVRLLTLAGAGVALMPDSAVRTDVERGALVRVLPSYALRDAPVHVVSAPLRHVPARVTLLRDFLLRELPRRLAGTPCAVEAASTGERRARRVSAQPRP